MDTAGIAFHLLLSIRPSSHRQDHLHIIACPFPSRQTGIVSEIKEFVSPT